MAPICAKGDGGRRVGSGSPLAPPDRTLPLPAGRDTLCPQAARARATAKGRPQVPATDAALAPSRHVAARPRTAVRRHACRRPPASDLPAALATAPAQTEPDPTAPTVPRQEQGLKTLGAQPPRAGTSGMERGSSLQRSPRLHLPRPQRWRCRAGHRERRTRYRTVLSLRICVPDVTPCRTATAGDAAQRPDRRSGPLRVRQRHPGQEDQVPCERRFLDRRWPPPANRPCGTVGGESRAAPPFLPRRPSRQRLPRMIRRQIRLIRNRAARERDHVRPAGFRSTSGASVPGLSAPSWKSRARDNAAPRRRPQTMLPRLLRPGHRQSPGSAGHDGRAQAGTGIPPRAGTWAQDIRCPPRPQPGPVHHRRVPPRRRRGAV